MLARRCTLIPSGHRSIARACAQLDEAGCRRGNALQLVSHLLAAAPRGTDTAVQRCLQVAANLKAAGERTSQGRYDETALLAFTRESPGVVAERVLHCRDRLRAARPGPSAEPAFSLTAGIQLAEDSQRALESRTGDPATLQSLCTIPDAQQAATTAAISGDGRSAHPHGSLSGQSDRAWMHLLSRHSPPRSGRQSRTPTRIQDFLLYKPTHRPSGSQRTVSNRRESGLEPVAGRSGGAMPSLRERQSAPGSRRSNPAARPRHH